MATKIGRCIASPDALPITASRAHRDHRSRPGRDPAMFSGLAQHANHRDPPLALHDAPGPKAPDARRSLLACSAASNAKSPADTEARSSRPFRRQPVHTPHQQAAAQVAAGSSAGSPSCTGPFVPRPGSDVRRRPGGRPHDSRPAPAAQELQVRTGQRHPDPGGQPTRPVTRAGQAPIPGMHYRLPRHERLNLSRKAEMTRKITGASGHEKIPVCGQLAPGARPSEFLVCGHEVSR
jgi:hypothetical protein